MRRYILTINSGDDETDRAMLFSLFRITGKADLPDWVTEEDELVEE